MATPPVFRVVEREAARVRAPVARRRVLDVPQPGALPRRDGPRARRAGEGAHRQRRRPHLPRLRRARSALVASAMQIAADESMWPVLGGGEVDEELPRDGRDVDHGRASSWSATCCGSRCARCSARRRSCSSRRCSARSRRRGGCSRSRPPALCAAAFCAPLAAYSVGLDSDVVVPGDHAGRRAAAVLVLGHVLPDLAAPGAGCARSPWSRRCGTASSWRAPRPPARSHLGADRRARRGARRVHRAPGCCGAGARFARRLDVVNAATRRPSVFRVLPPLTAAPAAVAARRAQRARVPAHLVDLPERLPRAAAVPAVDRHRRRASSSASCRSAATIVDYKHVRRARPARVGRDERLAARHDLQLLRQVQVLAHLRRDPRDAARHRRRRDRRGRVGADARRDLLDRVPRDDARCSASSRRGGRCSRCRPRC